MKGGVGAAPQGPIHCALWHASTPQAGAMNWAPTIDEFTHEGRVYYSRDDPCGVLVGQLPLIHNNRSHNSPILLPFSYCVRFN
jgi:hypothetical protein